MMATDSQINKSLSALNIKAWELRYSNRNEAVKLAQEAKGEAEKEKDPLNVNFARLTLAQLGFWMMIEGQHLKNCIVALVYFQREKEFTGITRANHICASMYDEYGQYEKSMQHALNSVKASAKIADQEEAAVAYTVLGQIYSRTQDHTRAIDAVKKALELRSTLKNETALASSLNLLARNYMLAKKYEEASKYYNESLQLRERIKDTGGIPWTYLGLATMYSEKKDWQRSLDYYEKAGVAPKSEKRLELLCLLGKGKVILELSRHIEALEHLQKALVLAEQLKIASLRAEAHELLAQAYEAGKDPEKALQHFKAYYTLRQEILSNEKMNMLRNQQVAFSIESAEKETEIQRLRNVELKAAFDTIEEKNREILDSIAYAKRIQDAYLPSLDVFKEVLPNAFLLYKPKDIVSGDFYWFYKPDKDSVIVVVADCTGHGVPGAIMSVICCTALNEVVIKRGIHDPGTILDEVGKIVIAAFNSEDKRSGQKDGMDIALIHLQFPSPGSPPSGELEGAVKLKYAGANNPLWIIKRGKAPKEELSAGGYYLQDIKANKQPIGHYVVIVPFITRETELNAGDMVYLFSDGYADQFGGPEGKKFKYRPLKDLLLSIQDKTPPQQHETLLNNFTNWKGRLEQIDDVCMIGIRI